jgi:pimeloyl-ACP methyl ester carboxylesterase
MLRGIFRNAAPTLWIPGAGHFVQEDAGEEIAAKLRDWLKTP